MARREGYSESELLNHDTLKVYMAAEDLVKIEGKTRKVKCNTLISAEISPETGIALPSFDSTIEDMNRIHDEIVWGD